MEKNFIGRTEKLETYLRNFIGNRFFYMMFEYKDKPGVMREGIYKFGVHTKSKSYIDGKKYTTSGKPSTMPKDKGMTVCEFTNREYIEKQAELNGRPTWTPHDYTSINYGQIKLLKYGGLLRKVDFHDNHMVTLGKIDIVPKEFEDSAKFLLRSGIDFEMVGVSEFSRQI